MVVTDAEGPFVGEITFGTLLQNLQINLSTTTFFFTDTAGLLLILVWCEFFLQQKSWMKLVKAMSKSVLFTREKLNRLPSPKPSFFRSCLMLMLNFPDDVKNIGLRRWQRKLVVVVVVV
ncbi:hypothetical protein Bca4012_020728 [Brassica carinata]